MCTIAIKVYLRGKLLRTLYAVQIVYICSVLYEKRRRWSRRNGLYYLQEQHHNKTWRRDANSTYLIASVCQFYNVGIMTKYIPTSTNTISTCYNVRATTWILCAYRS